MIGREKSQQAGTDGGNPLAEITPDGFRAIVSSLSEAIFVIDQGGTICFTNAAATTIFGYEDAEFIGRNITLIMPPDIAQHHDGYLQRYGETGIASIIGTGRRVTGCRKNGEILDLALRVTEAEINGAKVFIGAIRDISQAQASQRENELLRYAALLTESDADHISGPVDLPPLLAELCRLSSAQGCRLFGPLGLDISYPAGEDGGGFSDHCLVLPLAEGDEKGAARLEVYFPPLAVPPSETIRQALIASARQLLSRLHLAQSRSEAESARHLLQMALDALPPSLAILDGEGVILYVNRTWRDFGRCNGIGPDRTWVGESYLASLAPHAKGSKDAARALLGIKAAIAGTKGPESSWEYPCHSPEGEERWFQFSASPLHSGRARVIVLHVDITPLKRAERERQAVADELHQAARMESIGQLAAGFSHEANNMLQPLLNMIELTRDCLEETSPLRHNLNIAFQAGTTLKAMVHQLQVFGSPTGAEDGVLTPATDLIHLLPSLVADIRHELPDGVSLYTSGIPKETPKPGEVPAISVSLAEWEVSHILRELVSNALLSMEEQAGEEQAGDKQPGKSHLGELFLSFDGSSDPPPSLAATLPSHPAWVKLSLLDQGGGMEEAVLSKALDPFFTTRPPGKGKGLGLAVVNALVRASGGGVALASSSEGTLVDLYLPRVF